MQESTKEKKRKTKSYVIADSLITALERFQREYKEITGNSCSKAEAIEQIIRFGTDESIKKLANIYANLNLSSN